MRTKNKSAKKSPKCPDFANAREFMALSAADKEKVWNYYNRRIPMSETRALTPEERAKFERIRRRSRGRRARAGLL